MKIKSSIRVKAVVLLLVFLLNTVVGFACAIGMETSHEHQHAEKGHHQHKHSGYDHHRLATDFKTDHHSGKSNDKNCCKEEVTKLVKSDKLLTVPSGLNVQSLIIGAVLPVFYQYQFLRAFVHTPSNRCFVRSYHPPISDIRISIQSFQI
ncbi:hypothetical protein HDC90_005141 [Pedobacter sp. AK013]|uniref:hypothetical protein n=1 Tax=Pedobacter sp. AK013 TaxID=2723071 RepID=UPI00161CE4E2|nr:hypothetical protein [Pedobacter sp. AK013]MBB6240464.1 hypothetical protein [Pedobacter sp. AK013]